jgi:hypothetical protein
MVIFLKRDPLFAELILLRAAVARGLAEAVTRNRPGIHQIFPDRCPFLDSWSKGKIYEIIYSKM